MELEVAITEQVIETLKLEDQTIPAEANLIEYGLHSLAVMQLVSAFQTEYGRELSYVDFVSSPTIQDWAALLSTQADVDSAVGASVEADLLAVEESLQESALSDMQYSFWAGQQSTDVSAHLYVEFDGHGIDLNRLNQAVRQLLQIHPMLRAVISINGSQTIGEFDPDYCVSVDDWRDMSEPEVAHLLMAKREKLAHQELAIDQGQVVDFNLSLLPNGVHKLHIDVNMVAADATSILMIYQDLAALYEGRRQDVRTSKLSYFDYLQQAEQDQSLAQAARQDQAWWRSRLADIAPPPKLPLIAEKLRQDQYRCDSLHHVFSSHHKQVLSDLAQQYEVSLSTLLLGVFSVTVGNWASSNRFRLNLPMFERQPYAEGVDRLVGDFTNLLIFSVELFDGEAFGKMLQRLEQERQQCLDHRAYSGINVLRDLSKLHEDTEVAPIVYTCGMGYGEIISDSVQQSLGKPVWCVSQGPMVDLDVQVAEHNAGILVNWDVRTAAFEGRVVHSMFEAYQALIHTLVFSPQAAEQPLTTKLPLSQKQQRQLVTPNQASGSSRFTEQTLHGGFWKQVKDNPDNIALILSDRRLSYQQLSQDIMAVAIHLQEKGVQKGDCLAIALSDLAANVVVPLAIHTLGASYLSLDSTLSPKVIATLSGPCAYTIVDNDLDGVEGEVIELSEVCQPIASEAEDWLAHNLVLNSPIAYVRASSEQKGVVDISHQSASSSVQEWISLLGLSQNTCLLSLNALSGKEAPLDIFATLSVGGSLLLQDSQSSPQQWIKCIQQHQINTVHGPAALISALFYQAQSGELASLSLVLSGVGRTSTHIWSELQTHNKSAQLVAFGTSKQTVHYASFNVCDDHKATQSAYLSYGKALPGVVCKVINEQGRNCPDFVVGQLWVAGSGVVGDGIVSVGEEAATHFENKGIDWYNTEELAYYLPSGEIHLCGSAEEIFTHQGYRIDLQTIASVIADTDGVLHASLQQVDHQGEKVLLAGMIANPHRVDQQQIRRKLADILPRHLQPSHYWLADQLPVASDGTPDVNKMLSNCLSANKELENNADESSLLQAVRFIVSKTIGVDERETSAEDDFFDSGGDSLLATHLAASINQYFKGSDLTIVDIFVERTPANLAEKIQEKLPELAEKIAQVLLKVVRKNS